MPNYQKILPIAEYVSVSASVVGAVAAIATQQLVYAVAPLSLSVVLNATNRRQTEQRLKQQLRHTVASVDQVSQRLERVRLQSKRFQQDWKTLEEKIETIAAELQNFSTPLSQPDSENVLSEYEKRLATLEAASAELQELQPTFNQQLHQLEGGLTEQLQEWSQRQGTMANDVQTTLQSEITEHHTQLNTEIQQLETQLSNTFAQLDNRLEHLSQQLEEQLARQQSILPEGFSSNGQSLEDFGYPVPQLPTGDNFDLELNLGIDFGTGFTKVCLRDLAQDQAEIVTFVEAESDLQSDPLAQTLIPTKIAILADGRLLTGLTVSEWEASNYDINQSIEFIKMRLAALDFPAAPGWRLEQIPILDDPDTVESLCAYYLSQIIIRAQQWIEQAHPDWFMNQKARWSVNVGVPVEYCDSSALARFQRVLNLAWVLRHTPIDPKTLTLETLKQLTDHLRQWMEVNAIANLDCQTTPEIAAAVWSFLSSREAQDGFYTFFDVGDGTLDGAAFWFERKGDGSLLVDFYKGQVKPLGVTAFSQQAATELGTSPHQVRQWLRDDSDQSLNERLQTSQVRQTIQQLVGSVVMKGKKKHESSIHAHDTGGMGQNLRVFVGGGGGNTLFFRQTIEATHEDFHQESAGVPAYQIKNISPPKNLAVNGIDSSHFNRFAVAYGLCIPEWEGPTIRLPSQVPPDDASSAQIFGTPPPKHGLDAD